MKARLAPLIILLILGCISLGVALEKHGQKRKNKHNAWTSIISLIIEWGLILWAIL